ncbi:hypothetical protein [Clostridium sp. HBUAS56017]|uniref:hypothetical protein n=1 Tax=Clostridium sp. HBUAS56017 TaxID=2571128 RepID=UPI0011779CA9|nr:hypothetical protein [Clostridium sp. HBUAS56017]
MKDRIQFNGVPLENYSIYYNIDKDRSVRCYSRKQIRALYPKNNFKIVGEYPPKKESFADIYINNIKLPIGEYGKMSPLIYSPKGYIECEGEKNSYVVLKKNLLPLRIVITLICLAIILFGIYYASNLDDSKTQDSIIDIDPNAIDNDPNSQVNTSGNGIQIPGFKILNIAADNKNAQVGFSNPQGNPCYFVVSLILEDGTELYKSKMIPPGKGIYNILLEKTLPKGEYNGILKYETYGVDGLNPMNGANLKLTVAVK